MQVSTLTTEEVSLDMLRESYARSDFEKLLFACLPHGNTHTMTRIKKYKVTTKEDVNKIQRIRKDVLTKIVDPPDFQWTDGNKLNRQEIQKNATLEFDLYLRFNDDQPINMTLKDFLGEAGTEVTYIAGNPIINENSLLAEKLSGGTQIWMEICTDPTKARHKVYQILRAYHLLDPKKKGEKIIAAICLNEQWINAKRAAEILRENDFVKNELDGKMDLVLVWTKNRNLFQAVFQVRDDLRQVRDDLKGKIDLLSIAVVIVAVALIMLAFRMEDRFQSMEDRFQSMDDRLQSIESTLQVLVERRGPLKFLQNLMGQLKRG